MSTVDPVQEQSELVVAILKRMGALMHERDRDWSVFYLRCDASEDNCGIRASYIVKDGVELLSPFEEEQFFDGMSDHLSQLWSSMRSSGRPFKVILFILNYDKTYKVLPEYEDEHRWMITKRDGNSGIPIGLDA